MEPPLGSGAYKIGAFEQGRYISYERVADYWAKDLPVNVGQNNFDVIRYDYFGDAPSASRPSSPATVNLHESATASEWATGYDFPAVRDGRVKKMEIPDRRSPGIQGFFFNTRRTAFKDPRIREALGCLSRFRMVQPQSVLRRLQARGELFRELRHGGSRPPSPEELALLEPYARKTAAGRVRDAFFAAGVGRIGQDRACCSAPTRC